MRDFPGGPGRGHPPVAGEDPGALPAGRGLHGKLHILRAFYEEVLRFANSQSSVQFIIMGLAGDFPQNGTECSPLLTSLNQQFEGEVLLVRVQGKVRVSPISVGKILPGRIKYVF